MSSLTPKLRFPEFTDEWQVKKLGDIAKFSKGANISKDDIAINGKTEAIRYGELYTDYSETIKDVKSRTDLPASSLILSQRGDVIIPSSGETHIDIATASSVLKSGVALGGDINIIRSENNGVFLAYYLNDKKKIDIARLAQGVSVVHLYSSNLKDLTLNVPTKPEQEKIAEFLTAVDERVAATQQKVELLKKYKKGVMQKIFTQQFRFKDENGQNYPTWQEKKLNEIGEIVTGKTPSTSDRAAWGGEVLFVTPSDMADGLKYQGTTERKIVSSNKLLPVGSIMYTCIASIGKMTLSVRPSVTNQQINSLIVSEQFNKEFVYYGLLWLTPKIVATQSNNTLPIINKTEFSKFTLPVPNQKEQQKVADFLTAIDDKIEAEEAKLAAAKKFKKSILQRMFVWIIYDQQAN